MKGGCLDVGVPAAVKIMNKLSLFSADDSDMNFKAACGTRRRWGRFNIFFAGARGLLHILPTITSKCDANFCRPLVNLPREMHRTLNHLVECDFCPVRGGDGILILFEELSLINSDYTG